MKYPHIMQYDIKDCGAACLSMISEFYGAKYTIASLRNLIKVDNQGSNIYGIVKGAKQIHLNAEALEGTFDELLDEISRNNIKLPFIARILTETNFLHYIVVYKIKNGIIYVGDPAKSRITKIPIELFLQQWQGQIITFEPDSEFQKVNKRKGMLSKYFKYIAQQKKRLVIVILLSLILSLISIFSSNIFNYILDDASNHDLSINTYETDEHEHEHEEFEETEEEVSTSDNFFENISIFTSNIINNIVKYFTGNINSISLAVIALFIMAALIKLLRGYLLSIASRDIERPLTLDYYKHMIRLPIGFFGTRKTGEVMSRFSDTSSIRSAISGATLTVAIDSISAILTGMYMCSISITLFSITLVVVALYAIIVISYRKPIKNINHEILECDSQVESYLKESIDGVEMIKSYQLENTVTNKTTNLFTKLLNKVVRGSIVNLSLDALVSTITSIGIVSILWVGTILVVNNVIEFGEVFAFYYLMDSFLTPVGNLIDLQPTIQAAFVAAERLEDVVSVDTENTDIENSESYDLNGDIEFNNVDFRYGFRNLLLKNLNIKIKQGQNVALVGESGCGKTTIAKLLMSFYSPENGEIKINGNNISDISPKVVRDQIAYVSQSSFFFTDTVLNNLKYGNENATNDEIRDLCIKCNADQFIMDMPSGYDTILEENATNLSTGQKQRLAIVRALLKKPKILIIDEATGNLDTITENSIINTINSASKDITCLIIAHRLNTIKNCDNIFVMSNGRIAEQGTHAELMNIGGLYNKYYNAIM